MRAIKQMEISIGLLTEIVNKDKSGLFNPITKVKGLVGDVSRKYGNPTNFEYVDSTTHSININQLASIAKDWAFNKSHYLISGYALDRDMKKVPYAKISKMNEMGWVTFEYMSEAESVLMACQWLYDNTNKKVPVCDTCGVELGETACQSSFTDGSYCSAFCAEVADHNKIHTSQYYIKDKK